METRPWHWNWSRVLIRLSTTFTNSAAVTLNVLLQVRSPDMFFVLPLCSALFVSISCICTSIINVSTMQHKAYQKYNMDIGQAQRYESVLQECHTVESSFYWASLHHSLSHCLYCGHHKESRPFKKKSVSKWMDYFLLVSIQYPKWMEILCAYLPAGDVYLCWLNL